MNRPRPYGYSLAFRAAPGGDGNERGAIDMYSLDDPAIIALSDAAAYGRIEWRLDGRPVRRAARKLARINGDPEFAFAE